MTAREPRPPARAGTVPANGSNPNPPTPPLHTLHPGDVVCAERDARLETLLGSCVAIVLTDPRRTVGAMCHIVHSSPALPNAEPTGAYAEVAFDTMFAQLRSRGIDPKQCEAYVYGGGNMFPAQFAGPHVGERNARRALEQLADEGIKVLFHDLGGCSYRRLSWTVGPDLPRMTAVPI